MSYDPREYWPDRMQKEGALYVSPRNNKGRQWKVFKDAILLSMFGTSPGHILDFGCGVGRFAESVLEEADRYTGVDINPGAFEYAPNLDTADFVGLPEDKIPFEDGTFDSAMSLTVLQHIVDSEQFALWTSEISRVVKPSGYFYIIDDANQKTKMAVHMRVRGPEKIAEALGATVDFDLGRISAERPNSHYCFRAQKV